MLNDLHRRFEWLNRVTPQCSWGDCSNFVSFAERMIAVLSCKRVDGPGSMSVSGIVHA
jgi:hypothetical protein